MQDLEHYLRPERCELKSRERYVLDLRHTGIPESQFGTLVLPVCRGKYGRDYDVIEDELPPDAYAKLQALKRAKLEADAEQARRAGFPYGERRVRRLTTVPLGFFVRDIPPGAFIVRDTGTGK